MGMDRFTECRRWNIDDGLVIFRYEQPCHLFHQSRAWLSFKREKQIAFVTFECRNCGFLYGSLTSANILLTAMRSHSVQEMCALDTEWDSHRIYGEMPIEKRKVLINQAMIEGTKHKVVVSQKTLS